MARRQDTLPLACCRPAMFGGTGVPWTGFLLNIGGVCLFTMVWLSAGGAPFPYLLMIPGHILLMVQTGRNPNFVTEWLSWVRTRGRLIEPELLPLRSRPRSHG